MKAVDAYACHRSATLPVDGRLYVCDFGGALAPKVCRREFAPSGEATLFLVFADGNSLRVDEVGRGWVFTPLAIYLPPVTTVKAGDRVRFADPQDIDEQLLIMTVLEDRGERVLVELPINSMKEIKPTAVYLKSDLVLA